MNLEQIIFAIYVGVLILMSLLAFAMYLGDKKKAARGAPRTPEKALLCVTAFGGALGAFFGRIAARHKTDKVYFSLVIYLSLLLHSAGFVFLLYVAFLAK